jgi:hypothetical protein
MKVGVDLVERLGRLRFAVQFKRVLETYLCLIFEVILQLLNLKHSFRIDHLHLPLHQLVKEGVLGRYTFLKKVFEILLVLLNIVIRARRAIICMQDLLRIARVTV